MKDPTPQTVHLKDYQAPPFKVESIRLHFDFQKDKVLLKSCLKLEKLTDSEDLHLDGKQLKLLAIEMDQKPLDSSLYTATPEHLWVKKVPKKFELEIATELEPSKNDALEGLYMSNGIYCTQNEAEGFRRMTYYLDRPDVLTVFTTTLEADEKELPVLLANGNRVDSKQLPNGRHEVTWVDPFPKPCYLFALVAGKLEKISDRYKTQSGRDVTLEVYANPAKLARCHYAMDSLKASMEWDERAFGREYDLDLYMIVAVDDFNAGAMENKGLNIFNSTFILADEKSATDFDFETVRAVIGHEYFHNWTGNRITCRDWFQLSIKEGLTVFREQEFVADFKSPSVKRVEDASQIRTVQFSEDAGPMSHPVRPASYIEINNFYTATIYEKGAELIRMVHTLLGAEAFRKGMDLYFERYDGKAVTAEDFLSVMEESSGRSFESFMNWYRTPGTPCVRVSEDFADGTYQLTLEQTNPKSKQVLPIPLVLALFDTKNKKAAIEETIELNEAKQTFSWPVSQKPVLSLLRQFSAPVRLEHQQTQDELLFLMQHETDAYKRWDATRRIYEIEILRLITQFEKDQAPEVSEGVVSAFRQVLKNQGEPAFQSMLIDIPAESEFAQTLRPIPLDSTHRAREMLLETLSRECFDVLLARYSALEMKGPYRVDFEEFGKRALRNRILMTLACNPEQATAVSRLARAQFDQSESMSDRIAALRTLSRLKTKDWDETSRDFYHQWKDDIVINKWFAIQALSPGEGACSRVRTLLDDPVFNIRNPNRAYSLLKQFAVGNYQFHENTGEGYRLLMEQVLKIDSFNPSVAARIATSFQQWKHYNEPRRKILKPLLQEALKAKGLSKNTFEILNKTLNDPL